MQEKVELIKNDGEKLNVDLISEFDIDIGGTPKRFVLLTANEIDQNGLIKILASNIADGKLQRIESDDEWTLVKNVMRSIISSSKGEFKYANTSNSLSFQVDDNYARVIAVQDAAKQALIKDYSDNKPEPEVVETKESEVKEDPNAGIYPTETESVPIGSEVVPGIAETGAVVDNAVDNSTESAVEEPKVEEVSEAVANETPVVPDIPSVEEQKEESAPESVVSVQENVVADNASTNSTARDELINAIIAAVDKYIASTSSSNNDNNVKDTIAKMQAELNKMTEALNTQA